MNRHKKTPSRTNHAVFEKLMVSPLHQFGKKSPMTDFHHQDVNPIAVSILLAGLVQFQDRKWLNPDQKSSFDLLNMTPTPDHALPDRVLVTHDVF
jgi:hypothetical protein